MWKNEKEKEENEEEVENKLIFLAYRGKVSEKFESSLRRIKAPVKVIFVLKKLKTLLPSLKPDVEKAYKSGVVYKLNIHVVRRAMSDKPTNIV